MLDEESSKSQAIDDDQSAAPEGPATLEAPVEAEERLMAQVAESLNAAGPGENREITLLPPPHADQPELPAIISARTTDIAVPERDPERIAFGLWNEGRVDEAITFLERAIAAEKDRAAPSPRALSRARRNILGAAADDAPMPGADTFSERRRRRRAALGADFSATGTPVDTIDMIAVPADQIVPLSRRRRLWPFAAALVLAVGAGFAGAAYYSGAGEEQTGLAALSLGSAPDAPAETASIAPSSATGSPATEAAAAAVEAGDPTQLADIPPADTAGNNAPAGSAAAASLVDAPATDGAESTSSAAVADTAPPPAAGNETASAEPAASATPDAAPPPDELADLAPTDAAATTVPADTPVMVARLPRERPDPPESAVRAAAAAQSSVPDTPDVPLVLGAPPAPLEPPYSATTAAQDQPPYGDPYGTGDVYDGSDAHGGPDAPRATLTPEEYRILLRRRALAEEYAARRGAYAEDQAPVPEYQIIGRVIPRWRRFGF